MGSNDMWRNASEWTGTIADAKRLKFLVPGAVLFIVEQDGGEPDKYKKGGNQYKECYEGNASHVGLYIGKPDVEVGHASSSRGKVSASTLKNAWTHVALFKSIDYQDVINAETLSEDIQEEGGNDMEEQVTPVEKITMRVELPIGGKGKTVNLRAKPTTDSIVLVRVPVGEHVTGQEIVSGEDGNYWRKVKYQGTSGYMVETFLIQVNDADISIDPSPSLTPEEYKAPLTQEDRVSSLEARVTHLENVLGVK